jgi:hypothetical protein
MLFDGERPVVEDDARLHLGDEVAQLAPHEVEVDVVERGGGDVVEDHAGVAAAAEVEHTISTTRQTPLGRDSRFILRHINSANENRSLCISLIYK